MAGGASRPAAANRTTVAVDGATQVATPTGIVTRKAERFCANTSATTPSWPVSRRIRIIDKA